LPRLLRQGEIISDREKRGPCAWTCPVDFRTQNIPVPDPLLFRISASLKVELNMKNRTETLELGSRAPDFSLGAANREGVFTLARLLEPGALVLEFLRGTW
jgi:hypothetical protein